MFKNIVIDAGHGGIDSNGNYTTSPGKMFTFPSGEVAYEGELNRQIAGHLFTFLKNHRNLNIVTTVKEDDPRDLSLGYRVRVANQFNKDETILVSIHCNAGGGTGFEIFTTVGETKSDKLAQDIGTSLTPLFNDYGVKIRKDLSDGDLDKEVDFYVLRKSKCPAVLLECGFFDHEEDYKLLSDSKYQAKLAYRVYEGIIKFIE